jgi:HTH-type transcriptional regulator / antitoxin HigA
MTESSFASERISAPGETIEDVLEERGWTQADLAERTGFTRKHVNEMIQGRAAITPDTALRLETVLGSTASFWLNREVLYRATLERKKAEETYAAAADWLQELPLAHMIKHRWVSKRATKAEQVASCLSFFGVASVDVWRAQYGCITAAFRAPSTKTIQVGAAAAWLRHGEREADKIKCDDFDATAFRAELSVFRHLTRESDPTIFVPKMVRSAARCGVAVIFAPAPKDCPASGATKWLGVGKALLMLSLRYKTDDHLWFTFFHEAAHLLLHGKKMIFVEGMTPLDSTHEDEADRFARDHLIPPQQAKRLKQLAEGRIMSALSATSFAKEVGVAPGIIVGRAQKEGWLRWTHLNALKIRYSWTMSEN